MAFKICTIGCGNHSALVHGPSYQKYVRETPDTILAACCDLNEEKALAYRERFGFKTFYTDMNEMLDAERPDAVCVVVPESHVCSTSVAVMEKGYHVLLEKPPGLDREECLRLIDAAQRAGVINQVAFNRRHMPLLTELKARMEQLEPGTIQNIFYEFYRYDRKEPSFETTAIHGIDVVKYLAGSEYQEVRFTYQELPAMGKGVVNIYLDCQFENGIRARLNFCPCSGVIVDRACVNASGHTFFLRTPIWNGYDTPGSLTHIRAGVPETVITGMDLGCGQEMFETNGFYEENRAFFEDVRSKKFGRNDIRSALQSVEIAQCIRERADRYSL